MIKKPSGGDKAYELIGCFLCGKGKYLVPEYCDILCAQCKKDAWETIDRLNKTDQSNGNKLSNANKPA